MDFTSMNFGDILFAINCNPLKNEIRKIEKINKRIVQTKNGIYFNEICLKEGLHPKFPYIYIYVYHWKEWLVADVLEYLHLQVSPISCWADPCIAWKNTNSNNCRRPVDGGTPRPVLLACSKKSHLVCLISFQLPICFQNFVINIIHPLKKCWSACNTSAKALLLLPVVPAFEIIILTLLI